MATFDYRLLNPNAAAQGVEQVNAWADQAAMRRAGAALAADDSRGARDVLNRNGLLGQAQNVLQNEWATDNRAIEAEERERARQIEEEAREAEVLGTMATNLQAVLQERGPEAVLPAFDQIAATWMADGATQEEIATMRGALQQDPEGFLLATAGAVDAARQRYQIWQAGNSVGRFDRRTGNVEELFRAEDFEQIDPTKDLYRIPGRGGMDDPSGGAGAGAGARPAVPPGSQEAIVGDRETVIRTMLAEAAGEGEEGLAAVAAVMANRGRQTGQPLSAIATERGQFEPHMTEEGRARMARYQPGSSQWQRAEAALERVLAGDDPTGGADHFYSPGAQEALGRQPPEWDNGEGRDIGGHRFFSLGYGGGSRPQGEQRASLQAEPTGPGGPQLIRPGRPRAQNRFRPLREEELETYGFRPGTSAQINEETGQVNVLQGPPAASRSGANGGQVRLTPQDSAFLREMRTAARQGRRTAELYAQMEPLARSLDTGGVMALPGAATFGRAINPEIGRFQALTDQMTPGMRQGLPGAASDRDVAMFRSATPSVENRREANLAAIAAGRAMLARDGDYVAFLEHYAQQNGNLLGADEEWQRYANSNPLFEEGTDETYGMPKVRTVVPWRQWFGATRRRPSPQQQDRPAPQREQGAPRRGRYDPATRSIVFD